MIPREGRPVVEKTHEPVERAGLGAESSPEVETVADEGRKENVDTARSARFGKTWAACAS